MIFEMLPKHLIAVFSAAIFFYSPSAARSAEVRINDADAGSYVARWITVEGEIQKGDLPKIIAGFDRTHLVNRIDVWSPGGDVDEAIKIAEFANEMLVEVSGPVGTTSNCKPPFKNPTGDVMKRYPRNPANCVCYSACAVIWLAAPKRTSPYGVGVHRAKFDPAYFSGLNAVQAEQRYRLLLDKLNSFLAEHDVPKSILDKMNVTTSNDIHVLTLDEVALIGEYRPFFDELLNARCSEFSQLASEANELEKEIRRLEKASDELVKKSYETERLGDLEMASHLLNESSSQMLRVTGLSAEWSRMVGPLYQCLSEAETQLRMRAQGLK